MTSGSRHPPFARLALEFGGGRGPDHTPTSSLSRSGAGEKTDAICSLCGDPQLPGGEDPCWGWLAGVAWACCGHASMDPNGRYISTLNGRSFRGFQAMQKYLAWRETPEGRMVVAIHEAELVEVFGWTWPEVSRGTCRRHGILHGECGHLRREGKARNKQ